MADHQITKPPKPKLKKGENPQDPSFQKRLRAWNRQIALLEATQAQAEQNEREAAERAKRDVLQEAKTQAPSKKDEPKTAVEAIDQGVAEADKDSAPRKGVRGAAAALAGSTRRVDAAVEEAQSGRKKKRKK